MGGAGHGGVNQAGLGLGLVHVVEEEVEVPRLIHHQRLVGSGQLIRICDVGVAGVFLDADVGDGVDMHGVTGLPDVALIVAVEQVGVHQIGPQGVQQSGIPYLRDKRSHSH